MFKLIVDFAIWLLKRYNFMLFVSNYEYEMNPEDMQGYVVPCLVRGGGLENLTKMAQTLMERDKNVRGFVLDAALNYLRRYEVDQKNFVKALYEKD